MTLLNKNQKKWVGDLGAIAAGLATFTLVASIGLSPKPIEPETPKGKAIKVLLAKQKAVVSTEKQEVPIQADSASMELEITKTKTWTEVEQPLDVKNGAVEEETRPEPKKESFVSNSDQEGVFVPVEERAGKYEGDPYKAGDFSLVQVDNKDLASRLPDLGVTATPGGDTLVLVYLLDSTGIVHDARQLVASGNALEDLTLTTVFYEFIGKQIVQDTSHLNLGPGQYKWMVYELKHKQEQINEFIP